MEIDRPTAADYANANADAARQAAEGNTEKRLELEEQIVILRGQVGFLAGWIEDLVEGREWHWDSDRDMLNRIAKQAEE